MKFEENFVLVFPSISPLTKIFCPSPCRVKSCSHPWLRAAGPPRRPTPRPRMLTGKEGEERNPPLPPSPPQSSSPPLPPTPSPYQHNGNLSRGEKKPLVFLTYERAPPGNIKYRTSICDDNRTGDVPRKSNSGSSSMVVLTWNRRDKFLSRVVEGGFFSSSCTVFPFSGEGQATLSPLSLPPLARPRRGEDNKSCRLLPREERGLSKVSGSCELPSDGGAKGGGGSGWIFLPLF